MSRYVDLSYERGDDGIYDLVIEDGDFKTTDGLEAALFVSLFSDRRAYADEVPDPRKRRGWIGDLVAEVNGDKYGSGLWLYEQHRLTQETVNGVRVESEQALEWMVDESLVTFVTAVASRNPVNRLISLNITLTALDGSVSSRAFELADATRTGSLVSLGG